MKNIKGSWAVVLCGGTGSRMGDLTKENPKPLLKVNNKPIIWHACKKLIKSGFKNIIFPIGYKGNKIKEYVKNTFENECNLIFKETGEFSPIAKRMGLIKEIIPESEDFFLLNSDTIFDFDIKEMYNHHIETNSLVTLSSTEVVSPWGIMTISNGKLIGFDRERKVQTLYTSTKSKGLVNSGLAWINKSSLNLIDLFSDIDFETELFKKVISMNRASYFQINGIWIPIDTPKDLNMINLKIPSIKDEKI